MREAARRQLLQRLAVLALTGGAGIAHSEGARWEPWPAKRKIPSLPAADVDDMPWALAQVGGAPILLNFWASWCEPCRAEMQSFVALEKHFQDYPLKVVTVNFKESSESVRRFREANQLPFVWLRDSYGDIAKAWGVRTFPTSVLINRHGRPVLSVVGEVDWASPAVHKRLAVQI